MRLTINITYAGRSYDSIREAAHQMIIDGIREMIEDQLKPFEREIRKQGGKVEMHLDRNFKGELTIKNIDDELRDRIKAALK